ncbi:MAG: protein translocase subunit SecF [SAR324 cluster bacterium]|nr:protein translocase subunit SecF [SAR324 cluster bacterium]
MISLFKQTPEVNFLEKKAIFLIISAIFVGITAVSFLQKGLSLGLDFKGGTLVQVLFNEEVDQISLQEKLSQSLGIPVSIRRLGGGDSKEMIISFSESYGKGLDGDAQVLVKNSLTEQGLDFEIRQVESIGPKMGGELRESAWYSILLSMGLILLYMTVRFKWYLGIGAIVALVHDAVVTMGAFSLFNVEFDLTALAGVLTLLGYSMNDTIVLFDRVRENIVKHPGMKLTAVINLSVNETMSRTILTFATTFIVIFAMYFFGGESIKGFSFAFLIGLVVGTYSSVFIASPFAIWSLIFFGSRRAAKRDKTQSNLIKKPAK